MADLCRSCKEPLKSSARFCGRCGEPTLVSATPPPPVALEPHEAAAEQPANKACGPCVPSARGDRGSWAALLAFLLACCFGVFLVFRYNFEEKRRTLDHGASHSHSWSPGGSAYTETSKTFEAGREQSSRLFQLLKPKDVEVRVGLGDGNLSASGTAEDVSTVESIIRIIKRGANKFGGSKSDSPKGPFVEKSYNLAPDRAKDFEYALSLSDWSVNVKRRGGRVVVTACKEDQESIARFVKIIGGEGEGDSHHSKRR